LTILTTDNVVTKKEADAVANDYATALPAGRTRAMDGTPEISSHFPSFK